MAFTVSQWREPAVTVTQTLVTIPSFPSTPGTGRRFQNAREVRNAAERETI